MPDQGPDSPQARLSVVVDAVFASGVELQQGERQRLMFLTSAISMDSARLIAGLIRRARRAA